MNLRSGRKAGVWMEEGNDFPRNETLIASSVFACQKLKVFRFYRFVASKKADFEPGVESLEHEEIYGCLQK